MVLVLVVLLVALVVLLVLTAALLLAVAIAAVAAVVVGVAGVAVRLARVRAVLPAVARAGALLLRAARFTDLRGARVADELRPGVGASALFDALAFTLVERRRVGAAAGAAGAASFSLMPAELSPSPS
ncbi:hypothetical protein [Eggerthella sinensis]|uniref:hypothetical protein n=1 Tax=Eggerthella sinensis TaxID=242230 RepID=UPI0022E05C5C|nr:hypothetical protein [Eggerthella sinensis]